MRGSRDDGSCDPGPASRRRAGPPRDARHPQGGGGAQLALLEPYQGVDYKLLWRSGKSVAGLMRIDAGAEVTSAGERTSTTRGTFDPGVFPVGQRRL